MPILLLPTELLLKAIIVSPTIYCRSWANILQSNWIIPLWLRFNGCFSMRQEKGTRKRIRSFLSKGADINFQPKGEWCTPLCGALLSVPQPLEIVKLLLDHGADPNITLLPSKSGSGGWKPPPSPPLNLAMLREESLQLFKVLLKAGTDAQQCGLALFDAVRLKTAAEFRLLVDHHADLYVCLKGRPPAECARLQSNCQVIQEACLGLDTTVPTRELARRTAYRLPSRRRRRQYLFPNDTILTIRAPALG